MHANFIKLFQDLRASYWFIPGCMAIASLILSFLMQWLDAQHSASWLRDFNWLTATRTEGARSVLTVIAGSIIGVAGVTFSITIVAVSYASANFGPRLIGNFMRDRGNQVTLGTFIATFVYCLMILRTVRNATAEDASQSFDAFVPHLSILMALALALASIGVLIYFIHHVPETINVGNIAAKIGKQLKDGVTNSFPDVEALQQPDDKTHPVSWDQRPNLRHRSVKADCAGYIQALDEERLAEIAGDDALLIRVQHRPGDFVTVTDIILDIWGEETVSEDRVEDLQACYAVGQHRTAYQNILFLIDEMVEIIARALSPGVNDPYTAITCFNWLKVGLVQFILQDEAANHPDASNPVQVYPIGFERFVSAIFDQSRQYVCRDRNVSLHVLAVLSDTAILIDDASRRQVLVEQMKKLSSACSASMNDEEGGQDIAERHQEALQILSDPKGHDVYRNDQKRFGQHA